jgi:hypothetical protein
MDSGGGAITLRTVFGFRDHDIPKMAIAMEDSRMAFRCLMALALNLSVTVHTSVVESLSFISEILLPLFPLRLVES